MSNALAIAGVTAVMRDLLNNGLIDHKITDAMGRKVDVSAIAPDLIKLDDPTFSPRLNIFLHQVTPNPGWRNVGLPVRDSDGRRVSAPPLALDLHYLVTSYGKGDLEAEVLLGYAAQLIHETPVFTRQAIRVALSPPSPPVTGGLLPTIYQALRASALADQVESLKITPIVMNGEEMSRLWSAMQARYRPTLPLQVSVVLIESQKPGRSALPVLTRGPRDPVTGAERGIQTVTELGSPYPEISAVEPPAQQPAARLGEVVTVRGTRLDGAARTVLLTHPRLDFTRQVPALAGNASDQLTFIVPHDPVALPAGSYLLSVRVLRAGDAEPRETSPLLLPIAPRITTALPITVVRDAEQNATVTLAAEPEFRPDQRISLLIGSREIPATVDPQSSVATFIVPHAASGTSYVRLRVDGVESILVDRTVSPPIFVNHQITIV